MQSSFEAIFVGKKKFMKKTLNFIFKQTFRLSNLGAAGCHIFVIQWQISELCNSFGDICLFLEILTKIYFKRLSKLLFLREKKWMSFLCGCCLAENVTWEINGGTNLCFSKPLTRVFQVKFDSLHKAFLDTTIISHFTK